MLALPASTWGGVLLDWSRPFRLARRAACAADLESFAGCSNVPRWSPEIETRYEGTKATLCAYSVRSHVGLLLRCPAEGGVLVGNGRRCVFTLLHCASRNSQHRLRQSAGCWFDRSSESLRTKCARQRRRPEL
jgi:hypothetical protein